MACRRSALGVHANHRRLRGVSRHTHIRAALNSGEITFRTHLSNHSLLGGLSDAQWNWLIAASCADFALIEPDRVTVVFPSGYEIRDRNYRLVSNPTFPRESLRAAGHKMRRFYR